ncbi:hypothetical protein [Arthrobacter silvisoli]|uniref:hypothetical protein n=1 Tax=Arthrobacter silvisoli TaxID=2291022 RepID=UPI00109BAFF7|nr:hypothetical protein [Arthrobacter silvisoli]
MKGKFSAFDNGTFAGSEVKVWCLAGHLAVAYLYYASVQLCFGMAAEDDERAGTVLFEHHAALVCGDPVPDRADFKEEAPYTDSEGTMFELLRQAGQQQAEADQKNGYRFTEPVEDVENIRRRIFGALNPDDSSVEDPIEKHQSEQEAAAGDEGKRGPEYLCVHLWKVPTADSGDVDANPHDESRAGPEEDRHPKLIAVGERQVWIGNLNAAGEECNGYCRAREAGDPSPKGELPPSYVNVRDCRQKDCRPELPKPEQQGQERDQANAVSAAEERVNTVVDHRDVERARDCRKDRCAEDAAAVGIEGSRKANDGQDPEDDGWDEFH